MNDTDVRGWRILKIMGGDMDDAAKRDHSFAIIGVMAFMGAFYWAIRGTGGYGGEMGGILAGFGWGLLWYGFSQALPHSDRRPYGAVWMILAMTAGIAYGGATGYGVYISWVNGKFQLAHGMEARSVSAWTGYAMLFLCGLHWGGNTGCFMSWCAPERRLRGKDWLLRLTSGLAGGLLATIITRLFPSLFLPFFREGIYGREEYDVCIRALHSIQNILPHVGTFLGFLAYEWGRGDKRAVKLILTLALGFAIPFAAGGIWHTFHDSSLSLSWWKNWEMTIGFGGGLSMGLAFMWFNTPMQTTRPGLGKTGQVVFGSGIPLWLPTFTIMRNCWDGWTHVRSTQPTLLHEGILFLSSIAIMAALLGPGKGWKRSSSGDPCISFSAIYALQGIIVGAGWLVTLPLEWRLSNAVLAGLYAFYILGSVALLARWRRARKAFQGPPGR